MSNGDVSRAIQVALSAAESESAHHVVEPGDPEFGARHKAMDMVVTKLEEAALWFKVASGSVSL